MCVKCIVHIFIVFLVLYSDWLLIFFQHVPPVFLCLSLIYAFVDDRNYLKYAEFTLNERFYNH